MYRCPFRFRFSLLGSLLAVVGLTVFVSLGNWQIDRAAEKESIEVVVRARAIQAPLLINTSISQLDDKIYAPIRAIGHYDAAHEILIDNAVMQGKAGYYVISPLLLEGQDAVVMVNRGWVTSGRDRNRLPELAVIEGKLEVYGILKNLPSHPPLVLIDDWQSVGRRWPFFNHEVYAARIDKQVLPYMIYLDADAEHGFLRDWPEYKANSGMHTGYAIQWYAFAAIVFFTYFGVNIKRVYPRENDNE